MPKYEEMLRIIARDPVAQARFFILAERLFCEHILGTGPWDSQLRHHGIKDGIIFPDGFAANGLNSGMNFIASLHGPIEEQARLSVHSHKCIQFINRTSQAWIREIVYRSTDEARIALRHWQEATLAAVEALQITSAAIVPLHFVNDPADVTELLGSPYTSYMQREDRFDGANENDAKRPELCRVHVPVQPRFVDHHVQEHITRHGEATRVSEYKLSLTGACLSTFPDFRVMPSEDTLCPCASCAARRRVHESLQTGAIDADHEARTWAAAFSKDYLRVVALSNIHRHTDTCFKYVTNGVFRQPLHCRFGFVHFVELNVKRQLESGGRCRHGAMKHIIARVGKEPVLPRKAGFPEPDLHR